MVKQLWRPGKRSGRRQAASPQRKLRVLLLLFLVGVAIPLYLLFGRVYAQLRQETLYQYRLSAEQVTQHIDAELNRLIAREENRPFSHYGFFRIEEQKLLQTRGVSLSPLAQFPIASEIPGLIGYFQIDPKGHFSSPVLPDITQQQLDNYNVHVGAEEYAKRLALKNQLEQVIKQNRLWVQKATNGQPRPTRGVIGQTGHRQQEQAAPAAEAARSSIDRQDNVAALHDADSQAQRQGDLRSTYRGKKITDLNLDRRLYLKQELRSEASGRQSAPSPSKASRLAPRQQRTEQIDIPANQSLDLYREWLNKETNENKEKPDKPASAAASILISFKGDIDPFQLYVLQDMTFVFVRKVWQARQRYIQGFIVDGKAFMRQVLQPPFYQSTIAAVSHLVISYRGDILQQVAPRPEPYEATYRGIFRHDSGAVQQDRTPFLLYQTHLAPPLDDVVTHFTITSLPLGPSAMLVHALVIIIPALLLAGAVLMYRLTAQQIKLAESRQDFVSAVSHELKTPLTSIRMYGEMLRSGWVQDDARRQTYYDFIFFESERLSRLVANVLHLARLTKNDAPLDLQPYAPAALLDLVRAKVDTQVEAAGFRLDVVNDLAAADQGLLRIAAEEDAFTRIFINLVDNALKFSAPAEQKVVRLALRASHSPRPQVIFSVRDYGPGVERDQMKKIFQLFYRTGSELTRTTPGTGIGLALVKQLAAAMHAEVDLKNHHPGAEFLVKFCPLPPP